MKKVILISGKARAGKDSTAQILKEELEKRGEKVVITHFAKYIKSILREFYCWNGEKTEEWRDKLQILGTDTIKEKLNYKCFHAKRIAEDIQITENDFDYYIIPDCRFRDEIYLMKSMFPDNTKSIRVHRLDFTSNLTDEQLKHKSEIDLDNFDFDVNIYVQSGLDHLYDETMRCFDRIIN